MTVQRSPDRPDPPPLYSTMYTEDPPPLLTAVNALAGEPYSAGIWIRTNGNAERVEDENVPAPTGISQWESHYGSPVIAMNGLKSPEAIANRVQHIVRSLSPPPKSLAIVFEHDWVGGGLWQMGRQVLSRNPTIDALTGSLQRTSYSYVGAFLSPDRMDSAHAFFAADSDLYVPARTTHPLRRLARVVGTHQLSHACTVILAQRSGHTGFPVLTALTQHLVDRSESSSSGELTVLGFQVRRRGTLLLFLESDITSERFVAKVGLRQEADDPLYNSYNLQTWLRESLVEPARSKIPHPRYFFDQVQPFKGSVYVESLQHGIIAWKVTAGRTRSEIERGSLEFLEQLQEATRSVKRCDEEVLRKLLAPALERAESTPQSTQPLVASLSRLGRCIRDYHLGKQVAFVTSHGDFGIGNILVQQHTGVLTAVLDWADGRRAEFPSVDLFNWYIQQTRDREGLSFVEAVDDLYSTIQRGFLSVDEAFLVEGRSYRERMLAGLYTAVFRYVERSLRYPWGFHSDCGSRDSVTSLLNRLGDNW